MSLHIDKPINYLDYWSDELHAFRGKKSIHSAKLVLQELINRGSWLSYCGLFDYYDYYS